MIRMCKKQKIDLVITKSISRFARNTVDCLEYVRQLKDLGIGVLFEKENINTLTMTSEFMIALFVKILILVLVLDMIIGINLKEEILLDIGGEIV